MRNLIADTTYSVTDLQKLVRPFVYGWTHKGEYMYIGKTLGGLRRILERHDVLPRVNAMTDDDAIDIWYTTPEEIDHLEWSLITMHQPKFNRTYVQSPAKPERPIHRRKVYFVGPCTAVPLS